ncbi:hypothetical protein LJR231_003469 [Phyllobacterium sp. LjRoot231]|uniref:hypothetical protein n=1 Tax=Phyllobacterium sp. LjRoot231 TaxID=3342289 RepID=UPI003ECC9999
MIDEIKAAAFRQLADNAEIKEAFADLERTTFEELLRLPISSDEREKDALIQRVQIIRDLQSRIRLLGTTRKTGKQSVV